MEEKFTDIDYRRTEVTINAETETASLKFNGRNGVRFTMNFEKRADGKTRVWAETPKLYETVYPKKEWSVITLKDTDKRRIIIESFLKNQMHYYDMLYHYTF